MVQKKSNFSLLYVEDDPFIRQSGVEFLENRFTHIYEASCGVEGLILFERHKPDIIITDIKMPKMDGLSFAKAIRQKSQSTPIIITTAFSDTEYLLEAIELGLIKYLLKPIEEEKLEEALLLCFERLNQHSPSIIKLSKEISYDPLNFTLLHHDKIIKLSANENRLLALLLRHKERIVTYQEIENHLYYDKGMSEDALKSLVRNLRQKISKEHIQNHAKIGYKINLYV